MIDVPVRTDDDAKEIEQLLNDGWTYQKHAFTTDDVAIKNTAEEATHQAVLTISTNDVDRDAEVVDVKGIDLKMFDKNPVLIWDHQWGAAPIGKALWTKKEGDTVKSLVQFAKRPATHPEAAEWFPDTVFSLVQQGILKGVSIGFLHSNRDRTAPTEKEIKARPEMAGVKGVIRKSLLLEISITPIPSNPYTLVESVSKGLYRADTLKRMGIHVDDMPPLDEMWEWESEDFEPTKAESEIVVPKKLTRQQILEQIMASKHR